MYATAYRPIDEAVCPLGIGSRRFLQISINEIGTFGRSKMYKTSAASQPRNVTGHGDVK